MQLTIHTDLGKKHCHLCHHVYYVLLGQRSLKNVVKNLALYPNYGVIVLIDIKIYNQNNNNCSNLKC